MSRSVERWTQSERIVEQPDGIEVGLGEVQLTAPLLLSGQLYGNIWYFLRPGGRFYGT